MKGLLRNNFYESMRDMRLILGCGLAGGIALLATGSVTILQVLVLILPLLLALNGAGSMWKNDSMGWSRYELILPIRRNQVVQSRFLAYLLWVLFGLIFTGILIALASTIYGFGHLFDRGWKDVWSIFSMGFGVSMTAAALFYPLMTLLGSGRSEVIMMLSVVASFGVIVFFIWVLRHPIIQQMWYYLQLLIFCGTCLFLFVLGLGLTMGIYKKKEF